MEMTILKSIAIGLFAVLAAGQIVSIIRAIRRIKFKISAERKLHVALHHELNEPEFQAMVERLEKEVAASRGQFDAELYAKLLEKVTEAAKTLNESERKEVLGGVYQPSQRGRVRYMQKIVEGSQHHINITRRAVG